MPYLRIGTLKLMSKPRRTFGYMQVAQNLSDVD